MQTGINKFGFYYGCDTAEVGFGVILHTRSKDINQSIQTNLTSIDADYREYGSMDKHCKDFHFNSQNSPFSWIRVILQFLYTARFIIRIAS